MNTKFTLLNTHGAHFIILSIFLLFLLPFLASNLGQFSSLSPMLFCFPPFSSFPQRLLSLFSFSQFFRRLHFFLFIIFIASYTFFAILFGSILINWPYQFSYLLVILFVIGACIGISSIVSFLILSYFIFPSIFLKYLMSNFYTRWQYNYCVLYS